MQRIKRNNIYYEILNDNTAMVSHGGPNLKGDVTIPEKIKFAGLKLPVTSIRHSAFLIHNSLTSIIIPDSVTSIGFGAFEGCLNLTSIKLPAGLKNLEDRMFLRCRKLISVTIPDSVTSIEDYAFYGCSGLTSVTLPDSLTSLGHGAFYECPKLKDIFCRFDEEPFIDFWDFAEGPVHRTIYTKNEYIDMVPFYANRRMVIAQN